MTRVGINAVDTGGSVAARVGEAFVDIVLTVGARGPRSAPALISVDQVLTRSAVTTRVAQALVDLTLAQESRVARVADASECVCAIYAFTMVARR